MQLDVYSDAICPWCFIGKRRLDKTLVGDLASGIEVDWRTYQLYPQIPLEGMDRDEFMTLRFGGKDKARDGFSRIEEEGAGEGITFDFRAMKRMPNTRHAHRLSRLAASLGVQTELIEQLFRLHFCEGQDIGDRDTLVEAGFRVGIAAERTREYLDGEDGLAEMLAELKFALEAGISGVPCFVINREFGIPGAQPVEVLTRYFTKAKQLEALMVKS